MPRAMGNLPRFPRQFDIRSVAVACAASGALPLLVVALLDPTFVQPAGVRALVAISVFTVVTVLVTARVGVLGDRQFVVLGTGGMLGVAVSAYVIVDPVATAAVSAMLAVVPAIAAAGSPPRITGSLTASAIALAIALGIIGTSGTARVVAIGAMVTIVTVPTLLMTLLRSSLLKVTAQLEILAETDPLTSLLNRRGLTTRLAALLDEVCVIGDQLAIFLIDVDHFKAVNDTLGHAGGDDVLVRVAETIREQSGPYALVTRLGGEEFLVLGRAKHVHELEARMLHAFRASRTVTVSIGVIRCAVTAAPGSTRDASSIIDELTTVADRALYAAKNAGRDRAAHAGAPAITWAPVRPTSATPPSTRPRRIGTGRRSSAPNPG